MLRTELNENHVTWTIAELVKTMPLIGNELSTLFETSGFFSKKSLESATFLVDLLSPVNFTKEEILDRANVWYAQAAIILADTSGAHPLDKADERTLFACLAIESRAPKVKTCAELIHAENKDHLKRAGVDKITVRGEPNSTILAGAAAFEGLASVMKRLLDMDEPNKLWQVKVPDRFIGRTVEELTEHYHKKHEAILIAVVTETSPMRLEDILSQDHTAIDDFIKRKFDESGKDYFTSDKGRTSVQINPPREYVLTKQDAAIVLGRTKPA